MEKQKRGNWWIRLLSCAVMLAMLMTMLPARPVGLVHAETAVESPIIVKNADGTYKVTLQYGGEAGSVGVRGTIPGTNWDSDAVKMSKNGGVWSVTLNDLPAGNYKYKFMVDGEWTLDPANPLVTGTDNQLILKETPVVTDNGNGTSTVTLRYAETSYSGTVTSVEVMSGDLPGTSWTIGSSIQMQRTAQGSNIWWATFQNVQPGNYEYKFVVNGDANGWTDDPANPNNGSNSKLTVTSGMPEFISPEVKGREVTFRYYAPDAGKVYLAGEMNGWNTSADPLTKGADGVWSITKTLEPGVYGYKFFVDDDWRNDQKNTSFMPGNDNNRVVVPGLAGGDVTVKKGETVELPATLTLVSASGESTQVTPTYTLPKELTGVVLKGTTLTVGNDCTVDSFEVTAASGDHTSQVTVHVVSTAYTYYVYYFDWDQEHMSLTATDLWMWEVDGAGGHQELFTGTAEIDGHTWLKATLTSPATKIGLVARSYGQWDVWKTSDHIFENKDKSPECNVYFVYGDDQTYDQPPTLPAEQGRAFYVPGTFPGPSWDAGSNKMTVFDEDNQIYSHTFANVPAGNYEFKIAINSSWNENYGVGGAPNGGNYSVSVPKAQDVTVYYSDVTHLAVTSVTYSFQKVLLEGPGILAGAELLDSGLTGIYSVKVPLPAGEYTGLKLSVEGDSTERVFPAFTLDADKEVTFYYAPAYGLYYHDAVPANDEAWKTVYFNSKDADYKSVYGAVATGESVTFALDAGEDITGATLVIGSNTYAMTPGEAVNGVRKWTVTVNDLNTIGEYDYFFVVSQASAVKVYSDDDGYYGPGAVTELTQIHPYDLVVYQSGFKTPDWMKNAVIYQIFPDRFYNGDPSNDKNQTSARGPVNYEFPAWDELPENPEWIADSNYPADAHKGDGEWSNEIYGGDLDGITAKIAYLKSLGVTVIYLNPVFASISSHRYDTSDYAQIDPILGDLGDFTELVEAAEANGMHIVLDGVFNHVSDDSKYFDRYYKYLEADATAVGAYPYWAYVYDYMAEHNVDQAAAEAAAKTYFQGRGITDFSYTTWFDIFNTPMSGAVDSIGERAGKPVYSYDGWWGYDSMPIIKATNGSEYQTEDWADKIIDGDNSITSYWLEQGSNGWRLDVANEVSDETWQRFREAVKATQSDAVIIGEIWDDATKYLMGDMYDSVMNYMFRNAVLSYAKGGSSQDAMRDLERLRERYPQEAFYAMMNLVDSHDTTRVLSYLDGIPDDRDKATVNTAFPTYEGTSDLAKQRQYLVAFLQFTYAGAPTIYYGDERGMVGADDPDDRRTIDWDKVNDEALLAWYTKLAGIRHSYSALRTGSVEPIADDTGSILGYVRRDGGNTLIVLANNAQTAQTVPLDLSALNAEADSLKELLTGAAYTVEDGSVTVTVPALSGVILAKSTAQDPPDVPIPEVPVLPSGVPTKPAESTTKPSGSPSDPPKTGDAAPLALLTVTLFLSLGGIGVLTARKRKKR